jgi:drug/metabolite transporter (DMT)-like permease
VPRTAWSPSYAALFGLTVLAWAGNYLFVRIGLGFASPLWLAALRALLGAAGLAVWAGLRLRPFTLDRRGRRDALLLGVPNTALFLGLWFVAASRVAAGQAAVVIYTFPLWVALFSAPLLGRRLTGGHLAAVTVGFAGIVLLSEPWSAGAGLGTSVAFVELLAAAVSWAIATVLFQRRFRPEELPEANLWQLVGGSAALLPAAVLVHPGALPSFTLPLVVSLLWLGLFGTAFAYAIWFALLARLPASTLSAYSFLVPLAALGLSVAFASEVVNAVQAVGIALVLVSIAAVAREPPPIGSTGAG